jgi:microcystin-dependent protein
MSNPYMGEIRMWGGTYAPVNWAFCDGQTLAISQNEALYSLVGTIYGGDGVTTFNLPDLRGRVPIHWGQGVGLSSYAIGQVAGSEQVTLTTNQLPQHQHALNASTTVASSGHAQNNVLAQTSVLSLYNAAPAAVGLSPSAIAPAGSSVPHENRQPSLAITFIIALAGIYPTQG